MLKAVTAILIPTLFAGASGCNNQASETPSGGSSSTAGTAEGHEDHPTRGPNGGDLIELGEEDYHAELVDGDGDAVTIYVLGSDATTGVAIDAAEMTVNVTQDGTPAQFKLAAAPVEGDPKGKSSRFVSSDGELCGHLHEKGAQAKLVVAIGGTQFVGTIIHDHDDDHGHVHE